MALLNSPTNTSPLLAFECLCIMFQALLDLLLSSLSSRVVQGLVTRLLDPALADEEESNLIWKHVLGCLVSAEAVPLRLEFPIEATARSTASLLCETMHSRGEAPATHSRLLKLQISGGDRVGDIRRRRWRGRKVAAAGERRTEEIVQDGEEEEEEEGDEEEVLTGRAQKAVSFGPPCTPCVQTFCGGPTASLRD